MVCLHFEAYLLPTPPPHPHPTPPPYTPTLHPLVSTHDTTSLIQLLRFSILFGGKLYQQLQVLEVVCKVID